MARTTVSSVPWTQSDFTLTCAASGTVHAISVTTPFRYASMESAPVIVCLDGAWTAGTVRDATRIMSMSDEAPEAIVVSVSFTDEKMSDYLRSRARWFSPTQWVPPEITGVKGLKPEETGRALAYLAFLRDQLLPQIEADYRVAERWLVGHSFSGLFGLRVLLTEPALFDKYLLASPSVWWDSRAILDVEAASSIDHVAAKVFLSAGEEEGNLGNEFNMCGNVIELADTLQRRGYPGLELTHEILPAESHSSTIGAAISRGVRYLR